jgi:protein phosphatase
MLFRRRTPDPQPEPAPPPQPDATQVAGMQLANIQGPGRRDYQQDAFAVSDASPAAVAERGLWVMLADGMGGMADGAEIAQAALDVVREAVAGMSASDPLPVLAPVIHTLDQRIAGVYHRAGGTTLVVARIADQKLEFASVGDSAVLLLRGGHLYEANRRHEHRLDMIEQAVQGRMDLADALDCDQAEALSSYIGLGEAVADLTLRPFPLKEGDVLAFCSDGVTDTLTPEQLRQALVLAARTRAQLGADALEHGIAEAALENQDNYTAVIVRL